MTSRDATPYTKVKHALAQHYPRAWAGRSRPSLWGSSVESEICPKVKKPFALDNEENKIFLDFPVYILDLSLKETTLEPFNFETKVS